MAGSAGISHRELPSAAAAAPTEVAATGAHTAAAVSHRRAEVPACIGETALPAPTTRAAVPGGARSATREPSRRVVGLLHRPVSEDAFAFPESVTPGKASKNDTSCYRVWLVMNWTSFSAGTDAMSTTGCPRVGLRLWRLSETSRGAPGYSRLQERPIRDSNP